ncbi:MAG: hypothetical protein AAF721_39960 [Myxococcota bacterium]
MQAVERMVNTARSLARLGSKEAAMSLLGQAVEQDPSRLDLHLEMAELEFERGCNEEGARRLESLAEAYLDADMTDEAAAVLAYLESTMVAEPGAVVEAQTGVTQPMTVVFGVPQVIERTHTEFCSQPVLLFPDGSPLPGQHTTPAVVEAAPEPSVKRSATPSVKLPALRSKKPIKPRRAAGLRVGKGKLQVPALRRPRAAAGKTSKRAADS